MADRFSLEHGLNVRGTGIILESLQSKLKAMRAAQADVTAVVMPRILVPVVSSDRAMFSLHRGLALPLAWLTASAAVSRRPPDHRRVAA